jgi:hypothetical protein
MACERDDGDLGVTHAVAGLGQDLGGRRDGQGVALLRAGRDRRQPVR